MPLGLTDLGAQTADGDRTTFGPRILDAGAKKCNFMQHRHIDIHLTRHNVRRKICCFDNGSTGNAMKLRYSLTSPYVRKVMG